MQADMNPRWSHVKKVAYCLSHNIRKLTLDLCSITKTYLYTDPIKPHFYTVKLGVKGYTLFFLFLLKNIDCGCSLEPPWRSGSNEYPQSMF